MLVVDTNILIYAANTASPLHEPCSEWLENQRGRPEAWYVTWPILYGFLRVSTHPRVMARPWHASSAWRFVSALIESPGLDLLLPTERHAEVCGNVLAEFPYLAGNIFHDVHTIVLMREHGIRQICTRDSDFHRFKFLTVIDPLHT